MFRTKPAGTLVGRQAFFDLYQITIPEDVLSQLDGDSLFFVYNYERGNRLGFVTKVKDSEKATEAMEKWEPTFEETIKPILPIWGAKGTAYTSKFRFTTYKDVKVHFQTFSLQDTGIVYALVDDYLIVASSFEATKAAIDKIKASLSSLRPPRALAAVEPSDKPPEFEKDVSLERIAGQAFLIGFEGTTVTPSLESLIKRLRPGGVLLLSKNIENPEQLKKLIEGLQRTSLKYSQLPLFIAIDQEGGSISRLDFGTEKTSQSAIQTTTEAYQVGRRRAVELRNLGINLNLSPVLDTAIPSDFLFDRTFQAERAESGYLAKALIEGQKDAGLLSTLKHFPGYGNISFNPEARLAVVDEFPDISSFVFALPAEPEFMLISNVVYPTFDKDPFSFSSEGVALIRSMGFEGIILTDDLAQPSLLDNYTLSDIVVSPLVAGVDMALFSKEDYALAAFDLLMEEAAENARTKTIVENRARKIVEFKKDFFFPQTSSERFSQDN